MRVWGHGHENPAGALSLEALADVAVLSRFHFRRAFHAMNGQTVAQAVRRLRLYRARVMFLGDPNSAPADRQAVAAP